MPQVKKMLASEPEFLPMGVYMVSGDEKESELSQLLALIADNEKLSPGTLFLIGQKFPALDDELYEMFQSVNVDFADKAH